MRKIKIALIVLIILIGIIIAFILSRNINGKYIATNSCLYLRIYITSDSVSLFTSRSRDESFDFDNYFNSEIHKFPFFSNGGRDYFEIKSPKSGTVYQILIESTNGGVEIPYKELSLALFGTLYDTDIDNIKFIKYEKNMILPYRFYRGGEKCEITNELVKQRLDSVLYK